MTKTPSKHFVNDIECCTGQNPSPILSVFQTLCMVVRIFVPLTARSDRRLDLFVEGRN